jgi:hypothetical protein
MHGDTESESDDEVSGFVKRMARENDIDFEDDVVCCLKIGEQREEGLLFEEEAEFCSVLEPSPALVSELVLDCTAVLCPDLALDNLSPAQLRQLVLAGRQREQQLQKQCDELHETRKIWADNWVKEQKPLIEDGYAHAKATARRECQKEAETERRNWLEEQQQKTLQKNRKNLGMQSQHNARKLMGLNF